MILSVDFPIDRPQANPFHYFRKAVAKLHWSVKMPSKNGKVLSEDFNLFLGIAVYQWVTGEREAKK
jgi:hypothetical protein